MLSSLTVLMTLGYAMAKHGGNSPAIDSLTQLFGGAAGNAFHGDVEALREAFLSILQPDSGDDLDRIVARCALHATYFCLLEGLGEPVRINTKNAAGWRKVVFERLPDQIREMRRQPSGFFSEAERGQLESAKSECELALRKLDSGKIPSGYDPNDLLAPAPEFASLRTEEQILAVEKAHGPLSPRVLAIFRTDWFQYLCWSFRFEIKHNQPVANLLLNLAVHRVERKVDELDKKVDRLDRFLGQTVHGRSQLDPFSSVPDLPPNYFERTELLQRSISLLLDESEASPIAVNALSGMGGVGKTVTAIALSQDPSVRERFSAGIIWIVVGRESAETFEDRVRFLGTRLNLEYPVWDRATLRTIMDKQAVLVILDDVWKRADIEPFSLRGKRGRVLYTSRNAAISQEVGARNEVIGLLLPADARQFLARAVNYGDSEGAMPMPWSAMILDECKGLILALSIVGAVLAKQPEEWRLSKWEQIARDLRRSDLSQLKLRPPGYTYASIDAAIRISISDLGKAEADRYWQLAILPEEFYPSVSLLQRIWLCSEEDARDTVLLLEGRSLATIQNGALVLHDLQLDYLRTFDPNQVGLRIKQSAFRLGMHIFAGSPEEYAVQMFGRTLFLLWNAEEIKAYRNGLRDAITEELFIPFTTGLDQAGSLTLAVLNDFSEVVSSVAVDSQGGVIVVGTLDDKLHVFDLPSRTRTYEVDSLSPSSRTVGLTQTGSKVVFSAIDGTLRVWDVRQRHRIASLRPAGAAMFVAIDPEGQFALMSTTEHRLRLWNLTSRKQVWSIKDTTAYMTTGAISSSATVGIVGRANGTLGLWTGADGVGLAELPRHKAGITAVATTPDGRVAISASSDGALRVWKTSTRELIFDLCIPDVSINSVAVTPDGFMAITGADDNSVRLWDLTKGTPVMSCQGHSEKVTAVAISPDGRRGYSGSCDQTVRVWDLNMGPESRIGNPLRPIRWEPINALAISGNHEWALIGCDTGEVRIWDLPRSLAAASSLQGGTLSVNTVAINHDGTRGIWVRDRRLVSIWDATSPEPSAELDLKHPVVNAVAIAKDGLTAIAGCGAIGQRRAGSEVLFWDLTSGICTGLATESDGIQCVSIGGSNRFAAAGDRNGTVFLIDLAAREILKTFQAHRDQVLTVCFSHDDALLVSGSKDGALIGRRVDDGQECFRFRGEGDYFTCAAFGPDDRHLLSGSHRGKLDLWNLESQTRIGRFSADSALSGCGFALTQTIGMSAIATDIGGHVHRLGVRIYGHASSLILTGDLTEDMEVKSSL